ncbi:MAG TPA: STAS domain-containing protein [Terriglobales bacterium]|nr:STAS domain-containing protein [Terriglobales bacterium]
MKLSIQTRETGGVMILTCAGRIMLGEESAALRDALQAAAGKAHKVVLNFAGVTYVDSGTLGMLVGAYTAARANGASIKLAALGPHFHDVLETTRLLKIFEVYETEEQALAALGAGAAAMEDKA